MNGSCGQQRHTSVAAVRENNKLEAANYCYRLKYSYSWPRATSQTGFRVLGATQEVLGHPEGRTQDVSRVLQEYLSTYFMHLNDSGELLSILLCSCSALLRLYYPPDLIKMDTNSSLGHKSTAAKCCYVFRSPVSIRLQTCCSPKALEVL